MVDQSLLTVFLALTAAAILIQTGILVGVYFASAKLGQQADRAIDATRNLFGPIHQTVGNLKKATARMAELSSSLQEQLRQLDQRWKRPAA